MEIKREPATDFRSRQLMARDMLRDDALGEACIAEHHQRMQRVGEPAQVFFLSFGKCHRGIIGFAGA